MAQRITESAVEAFCLEVLEGQGYRFVSPEELNRTDPERVIIEATLREMLASLNPNVPQQAQDEAVKKVLTLSARICWKTMKSFTATSPRELR